MRRTADPAVGGTTYSQVQAIDTVPHNRSNQQPYLVSPTPSQLLWEIFSHTAVIVQKLSIPIISQLSVARFSYIQLSKDNIRTLCDSAPISFV